MRVIRWGDRSRSNRERGGKGPVMSCGQNGGSRPTKPGASYDGVHKSRWKTRHFASDSGGGALKFIACTGALVGAGMVKVKVGISFKRLQVIFFHSYGRSIAPKITF